MIIYSGWIDYRDLPYVFIDFLVNSRDVTDKLTKIFIKWVKLFLIKLSLLNVVIIVFF
jgi:hypothetical protein